MKSNTKIEKQLKKKTNPELVETIIAAKKNKGWEKIAKILSGPRKKRNNLNLGKIDEETKEGEQIIVVGKVLSNGELNKKIKIIAISFSEKAKEKILKAKGDISDILSEIKRNPEAKGLRILE
jgi:large subunit ribosomal protein L18e